MIGGEIGRPDSNSDRAGDADPDPPEASRQGTGLRQALLEEPFDPRQDDIGSGGDVGRLGAVEEDLAREVGQGDVRTGRAEVGDEQVAGVGAEAEKPGSAATGRDADAILGQQAVVDQRLDPLRQNRAAEAGRLRRARLVTDSPCARTWSSTATSPSGVEARCGSMA